MTFLLHITLFQATFSKTSTLFQATSLAKVLLFFYLHKKIPIFLGKYQDF